MTTRRALFACCPGGASGHADAPALENVIEEIGAQKMKIMPVHTEHPEWFERRCRNRLVKTTEGQPVTLS